MKPFLLAALFALLGTPLLASPLLAQPPSLTFGEDYTWSEEVHVVSTIKVAPNRIDHYLAGIERTWVRANEILKEMGLLHDYAIYASALPNGGDFNMLLVEIYESPEQRRLMDDPARMAEFVERMEATIPEEETFQVTEGYTQIREIVGEYMMRRIELR